MQIAYALTINPELKGKPVNIDIRCTELILKLEHLNGSFQIGAIKGLKLVVEKIKTHYILRYTNEKSKSLINVFAKKITAEALTL